jgi:hypothetical protein
MNPEEARKNLDDQLSKMGYIHPENGDDSRFSKYMSYSVSEEQKKNNGYGDYVSQSTLDPYATFNEKVNVGSNQYLCPECSLPAVYECDCTYYDVMCKNLHVWYTKDGKLISGDPHADE